MDASEFKKFVITILILKRVKDLFNFYRENRRKQIQSSGLKTFDEKFDYKK
jgi:hypothetical protein